MPAIIRLCARCMIVVALLAFSFGLLSRHVATTSACGPYVVATDNTYSAYLQASLLFDSCSGNGAAGQTHRTNPTNYPWAQASLQYCVTFTTSSGCSSWTGVDTPTQQDETTAYYSVVCNPPNVSGGTADASGTVGNLSKTFWRSTSTANYQRC